MGRRQVNVYYHLEDSGRTHLQQLLEDYYATANAIQQVLKYTVTQEEEGLENKYAKLIEEIDNETDKKVLLNMINISEIIGICINNKNNTKKIRYDCDVFKSILKDFLENKNGYHSYLIFLEIGRAHV